MGAEVIPPEGGPETFDQKAASEINHARLAHLESLQLPLEGRSVLDVGCGVGHLAQFFVRKNCNVLCLDARPENIARARELYPGLEAHVANIEIDVLSRFGTFDVVFSYGLLYHLENPIAGLRNMASVSKELLLLETVVCDHALPILQIEDETLSFSQALRGLGSRPSPSYVTMALNRLGFRFVYAPNVPPTHQDFRFEWKNNLDVRREGHLLRCVFVASRIELHNQHLISLVTP